MTTDSTFSYEINNALDEALTRMTNDQALDQPRLYWIVCSVGTGGAGVTGMAGGWDCTEQVGLEYAGHVYGQPERVWAITDHDAFQRDCQQIDAPRAAR